MRVLVFGAAGMLGTRVTDALVGDGHSAIPAAHSHGSIDDMKYVFDTVRVSRPDAIINCAGVIPLANRSVIDMIRANALGPHIVAEVARAHDARMIHVSTDCVFSGMAWAQQGGRLTTGMRTDAMDTYGRSKVLGEPEAAVVVRTSFIGEEHGLLPWLLGQSGSVDGWLNAMWAGSTVEDVARALVSKVADLPEDGVYHLATQVAISKYDVCSAIVAERALPIRVNGVSSPVTNRALAPSEGFILRAFADALRDPSGSPWPKGVADVSG